MKILYCRVFGIGNAVCAVPAIKALRSMGHEVDVLVGDMPDDFGALVILGQKTVIGEGKIFVNHVLDREYDLAVLAIPFDGRWRNGIHFHAKHIIDGRTRPDPSTTGLISWKRHEAEYQMDYARQLGYNDKTPDCSFLGKSVPGIPGKIYVGVGYKKDTAGYWKVKHWGNEKFRELIRLILSDSQTQVCSTGDKMDMLMTMAPIMKEIRNHRFSFWETSLLTSTCILSTCEAYVGNDTGMMHIAASMGKKVVAYFNIENAITKSRPLCENHIVFDGTQREVLPEHMHEAIQEICKEHGNAETR